MRVTTKKVRQVILVASGSMDPGLIPESIALFDSNGLPIDFSVTGIHGIPAGGLEAQVLAKNGDTDYDVVWADAASAGIHGIPAGGAAGKVLTKNSATDYDADWEPLPLGFDFRGPWVAQAYPANAVVNYNNALWIATVAALSTELPGAIDTVSFTASGWTAAAVCKRVTTVLQTWATTGTTEAGFEHFFFDVTTAGTLTIDKEPNSASGGYMRIYNSAGVNFASPGTADRADTLPVGRYYIRIEGNATAAETGTIKITPGTAVINPGNPSPWLKVLQGVA